MDVTSILVKQYCCSELQSKEVFYGEWALIKYILQFFPGTLGFWMLLLSSLHA